MIQEETTSKLDPMMRAHIFENLLLHRLNRNREKGANEGKGRG